MKNKRIKPFNEANGWGMIANAVVASLMDAMDEGTAMDYCKEMIITQNTDLLQTVLNALVSDKRRKRYIKLKAEVDKLLALI